MIGVCFLGQWFPVSSVNISEHKHVRGNPILWSLHPFSLWVAVAYNTRPPSLTPPLTALPAIHSVYPRRPLGTQPPPGSSAQTVLPFPSPWHGCPLPYRSELCSYATFSITSPCFLFFRALNSLRMNLVSSLSSCFSLPLPRELHNSRNFTILWIFCFVLFWKVSLYFILIYNERTKNLDEWFKK